MDDATATVRSTRRRFRTTFKQVALVVAACVAASNLGRSVHAQSHVEPASNRVADVVTDEQGGITVTGSFGHSHNDYNRDRPLHEALDADMLSIEADVFLRGDELCVAHDPPEIRAGRTLRKLYLEPLFDAFTRHGGVLKDDPFGGRVRASGLPVVLMVDFKSKDPRTWHVLESQLKAFPGLCRKVTRLPSGESVVTPGPVIVVVSGHRPAALIAQARVRHSAIDGRYPQDVNTRMPAHLMPMISTSYAVFRQAAGTGDARTLERMLGRFSEKMQSDGRLARIWGTPDTKPVWQMMRNARMQLINTDQPGTLRLLLSENSGAAKPMAEVR